jgi:predicted acylesterase/phospholipase RssA
MKTALVISGGGCKGAFAIGAIEYMLNQGMQFDILVGTSTGALIAPMVASNQFSTVYDIYSNVTTSQLLKQNCWLTLPWRASLYNDKGLRKIIDRTYTDEIHDALNRSDKEVRACTVSLNTGEVCYWNPKKTDRPTFARALLASSNQPGLMPPVQVLPEEDYHVDGGVREIAPIQKTIELGALEIVAIVLDREDVSMAPSVFNRIPDILLRTLELMFAETRKNDIAIVKRLPSVNLTIIRPQTHLTENSLEFKPDVMRNMIRKGNQRAKELLQR